MARTSCEVGCCFLGERIEYPLDARRVGDERGAPAGQGQGQRLHLIMIITDHNRRCGWESDLGEQRGPAGIVDRRIVLRTFRNGVLGELRGRGTVVETSVQERVLRIGPIATITTDNV